MSIVSDVLAALDRLPFWRDLKTLPARVAAIEQRLAAIEGTGARRAAPPCPLCETGALRTKKVEPAPLGREFGIQQHTLVCDNPACGHSQTRQVDPGMR
jgi:hypothetical protein